MDLKLIERVEKSFPRISSLWIGIIAIGLFLIIMDKLFGDILASVFSKEMIYIIIFVVYFLVWLYYRNKLPRKKKDKIGLILSIQAENDKQKIRIKEDFFEKLKERLSVNNLTDSFDVLFLSDYQTEKVNSIIEKHTNLLNRLKQKDYIVSEEDKQILVSWKKIEEKTQGNFWIFGKIKERIEGEKKYFFTLDARVIHFQLQDRNINPVKKAFDDSWIRKISIDEKVELFGFELAAELVFIGLNYVTGIAAYISNDPQTAFKLHESLLNELHRKFSSLPQNLKKIQKNIIKFLADECVLIAHNYLLQEDKVNTKLYIDKIFQYSKDNYDGYLLKSVYEFSLENNPTKSVETCNVAMKFSAGNGTWRYNKAFLLLFMNEFSKALELYVEIENYDYYGEETAVDQVIYFNEQRLIVEPDNLISNFILGFVYFKKKNNPAQALEYFENIKIQKSRSTDIEKFFEKINKFLQEIKLSLSLR